MPLHFEEQEWFEEDTSGDSCGNMAPCPSKNLISAEISAVGCPFKIHIRSLGGVLSGSATRAKAFAAVSRVRPTCRGQEFP